MIKVGIVGTGLIAREHAQALAQIARQARLVAAADTDAGRLTDFAAAYRVGRVYASAEELIADREVDLVTVATPPVAHAAVVVAALDADKYVLCEKPLSQSLASAAEIAAAEARHPGKLSVAYQLRSSPGYQRLLWWARNGWIGEIESAVVERHGYIPAAARDPGSWWGRWGVAGGGVLITQLIHDLDIMLLAMGEPRSVCATMDTRFTNLESEDWIEADVTFDGGRTARCAASVNSGQMRGRLVIKGKLGSVSPSGISLRDPDRERAAIAAANRALPNTRPASRSLASRAARRIATRLGRAGPAPLTDHARLYVDIAQAIAGGGLPLPMPAAEALVSLQFCAAAYASALTGAPVQLPVGPTQSIWNGVTGGGYKLRPAAVTPARPKPATLPKSKTVRVGLIGLDTTHAATFTDILHNPGNGDHIPGARVVAAFAGGSPDMAISASRVGGFTAELRGRYGVPILESPEAVADAADVVFILSSDGRTHPGLFRSVAGRGKPVFIDKPFAISVADAELIGRIAASEGTKLFASSGYRYADSLGVALSEIRASGEAIRSCRVRYWGQVQPTQGRLFWYGVHGAEMLATVMGKGASSVTARTEGSKDIVDVGYADRRTATLVGNQNDGAFHVSIDTDRRTLEVPIGGAVSARLLAAVLDVLTPDGYPRLWRAADAGSVSGRPGKELDPDFEDTMEVVAILDAAQRSLSVGAPISLRAAEAIAAE